MKKARFLTLLLVCAFLAAPAPALGQTGQAGDSLVSMNAEGVPGDGWSAWPALSPEGSELAFASQAANLDPADTNQTTDIYQVRIGSPAVSRVSVSSEGVQGDAGSYQPALSAYGRVAVFMSLAANLTDKSQVRDTNGLADIYARERTTGQTMRVSVASDGSQADGWSEQPAISGDGRFVVFVSTATNLSGQDGDQTRDIYLHDRNQGITTLVSAPRTGIPPGGSASHPAISTDGRYIVYRYALPEATGILLYDRLLAGTEILGQQGALRPGVRIVSGPVISPDGNYVHWVESTDKGESTVILDRFTRKQQTFANDPAKPFTYPGLHFPVVPPGTTFVAQSATRRHAAYMDDADGVRQVFFSDQGSAAAMVPTVSGWVVDSTGLPLAGVRVQIGDARFIVTGADGAFRFDSLAPKTYPLTVTKEGYTFTPENRSVTAAAGSITEIGLVFSAVPQGALDAAARDIGMPYDLSRGCPSPFEPCDGPFNGFYSGDCTDLVMDGYLFGLDYNIQFALEADFKANPFHYYRWRNARSAHDMWRYFAYTNQVLSVSEPYQIGDIVFFDWQMDGIVDHVALVSEVNRRGAPVRMFDATGVVADNPGGLAIELEWKPYHQASSPGHARWNGLPWSPVPKEKRAATYLVAALDSPVIQISLKDASGRITQPGGLAIPGSRLMQTGLGTVISLGDPPPGMFAIELSSASQAPFELGLQLVHNGEALALHTLTGELNPGETRLVGVQVTQAGDQPTIELVP